MDFKKILKYFCNMLYYIVIFSVLIPFCGTFLITVYNNFMISSISFTLDTLFLDWNTTFASVTICEIYNSEKNLDRINNIFGSEHDPALNNFIDEVTFFRGSCESCSHCDNYTSCPSANFSEILPSFQTECKDLLSNCTWNNEHFECCDRFESVITEFGQCYSYNSIQAGDVSGQLFYMNRETGPGKLFFAAHEDIQIHIHPTNDIPFWYAEGVIKEVIKKGTKKEIILNVMEIFNDPSVYHTTPQFRNCRFPNELLPTGRRLFRHYSYSACIVECIVYIQIETCGCQFFNKTDIDSVCNLDGLRCLSKNADIFVENRQDCKCMSSCEEPEYNIVYTSPEQFNEGSNISTITVSMIDLPTQRYIRNVVKSDLDLFISVGGIAGLFFGLSFISIIEVIYSIFENFKLKLSRKQIFSKRAVK